MNNLDMYTDKYEPYSAFSDPCIESMHGKLEYIHYGHTEPNAGIASGGNSMASGKVSHSPFECSNPEHSWSVRKIGRKFYLECKQCHMLKLFFTDQH